MKNKFYIFFSWQSDVPRNKGYIDKKIKAAKAEILAMPEMAGVEIEYDHSTMNRSGSPDIVDTIHEKINVCDVFIADVTPITSIDTRDADREKLIPNPNVMTEAGFALKAIGDKRIILLMREDTGRIDDLPFDIRHRRVTLFPNDPAKKNEFTLTSFILKAIEYSRSYQAEEHQAKEVQHDSNIFRGLSKTIGDEQRFLNTVSTVAASREISRADFYLLDSITEYIGKPENEFIIPELQTLAHDLRKGIKALIAITGKYYSPSQVRWKGKEPDMTPEEIAEADAQSFYVWIDRAAGEYLEDAKYYKQDREIQDGLGSAYDQIISAYRQFRMEIKRTLFI